ncbi:MAG: S9 family peptidase [Woeseiaceae bacterium]
MKRSRKTISSSTQVSGIWILLAGLLSCSVLAQDVERRLFQPEDIHRIKKVADIAISPDGEWIAYQVGTTNLDEDESSSDLFMVNWEGTTRIQLTHTGNSSEGHPRFSPDGKFLAFVAARGDGNSEESDEPKEKSQVWLLNRSGGEAQRLTEMPGGVSAFEWSPDSTRLVLVSMDPEDKEEDQNAVEESDSVHGDDAKKSSASHDTPKPIVVNRYQFKQDKLGYLGDRYQRLYVFDLDTREASLLTPGSYDSVQPAWGPGGDVIAFSSKRQGDPDRHVNSDIYVIDAIAGAPARQVTTWDGPDSSPVFSPDGLKIAYLQGGPPKYSGYDPTQLAVISVDGGEAFLPTRALDLTVSAPRWSLDGKTLHFLVTEDRVRPLASMPSIGGKIKRAYPADTMPGVVRSFDIGPNGMAVVTTFAQKPAEIYRTNDGAALSDHNRELRESIDWATVEGFDSIGKDDVMVGSMLLKPPGFREGVRYPTIANVHGGPVAQDGYEFDSTSQALAAQGFLVVNPNYRGSSGRGREFSRAIYADWGNLEIQDIHTVMDKLVAEGLADPKRLGIGGWSYGGINTNAAIATDTRFAAAFSGAGVSNFIAGYGTDQYIRQYEDELGLPWESPESYFKLSYPFLHADRIETPTLFMCGEKDFNVPLINSEQMYQALRTLNVPTQLVIYPGEYHTLTKPSYIQDRLERMIEWYARYLLNND